MEMITDRHKRKAKEKMKNVDVLPSSLKEIVDRDQCPECLGSLDTGWECNDCGFDAMDIAIGKTK